MSRLLRLYPPAWRERYLAEFDDLLDDRPPTMRDRLDIVRGAIDAWIHPQVVSRRVDAPGGDRSARRLAAGAAAIVGGGLFVVAALAMNASLVDSTLGYKNTGLSIVALVGGMAITALAALALTGLTVTRQSVGWAAAVAMTVAAALTAMPWPVLIIGFLGYCIATAAFGWFLVQSERQPIAGLLCLGALLLTSMNTEDERALLAIPIGLAWIAIGGLALRRSPASTPA